MKPLGRLSSEVRDEHDDVDWPDIIGLRHRLIHGYFDIDVELLWEIAQNDVPLLRRQLEAIGQPPQDW